MQTNLFDWNGKKKKNGKSFHQAMNEQADVQNTENSTNALKCLKICFYDLEYIYIKFNLLRLYYQVFRKIDCIFIVGDDSVCYSTDWCL